MSELPAGWRRPTIGSLCELINGRAFKPTDWGESGLPIVRIQNLNDPAASFNRFAGEVRQRFLIDSGDLLFAWSGTPGTSFGAHIWNRGPAILNQHIFKVVFDETAVNKQFLKLAINQKLDELIDKAHGGVGLRHVTKGRFEETEVVLPPYDEQGRIIERLDGLFIRSKSAREDLARIPRLVQRYKEAILAAAFRGDLTSVWRQDDPPMATGKQLFAELVARRAQHSTKKTGATEAVDQIAGHQDLPHGWTWCPVAILASTVSDGVHKKPDYVEQGVPFLTVRNLTAGPGITFDGCRYVTQSDHEEFIKRTHPERGDILISKDGTLGVVRAVRTDVVFSIFVSVALVKPVDRSMTDYLELAFTSPQVQQQMVGVGTGLQHIHLTDLRRDFVPIAPVEERAEIVKRVHSAFAYIERLETETIRAATLIERLDQATIAKAFRGELRAALKLPLDRGPHPLQDGSSKRSKEPERRPIDVHNLVEVPELSTNVGPSKSL